MAIPAFVLLLFVSFGSNSSSVPYNPALSSSVFSTREACEQAGNAAISQFQRRPIAVNTQHHIDIRYVCTPTF